ncbi:MAG: PAS domain S-box protein [Gammaproteobacteria bacterium]|nr:PAS domain S-box protein [Gammaproteobacteria bacterium]
MASPDTPQFGETLHQAILQTLSSAVISIKPDGTISTFNAAAADITGLDPNEVIGHTFAEIFLPLDETEEFTQAVLDSVYTGPLVHQRVVETSFKNRQCSLSMSVSRITGDEHDDSGVAVVFEDITELSELRTKELALAHEIESQHKELRQAYLRLEDQNTTLAEANRQTRLARYGSFGAVVVLLTVIGLYVLDIEPAVGDDQDLSTATVQSREPVVLTIEPSRLNTSVTVTSRLAPLREVDVTSPITGKVASVAVNYGNRVEQGDELLKLDDTAVRIEHREAQAAHIKALERLNEVENWSDGVDVSRARRSVAKARFDLEDSANSLEQSKFLFERGVIPADQHAAAERTFTNRELDLEAAEQDYASIVNRGSSEARVASLEVENARARLDELDETLRLATVTAPVSGVVMRPPSAASGDDQQERRLAGGESVTKGERLFIVGDLSGLAVVGRVDEVDVLSVRAGNDVIVRGDAFPGTTLRGLVQHVSSEAIVQARAVPFFEVTAAIPEITDAELEAVRIGMSAELEIVIRQVDAVVLVPIDAVQLIDGQPTVQLVEADGTRTKPVRVGVTTVDAIEILDGITTGDQILVP